MQIHSVVAQSLSHVWLFATPWAAACQTPLSSTISQSLLKFMFIESVMLSNHLILYCPLLLLLSFLLNIRVFPKESALCVTWPKYWSFSISLPMHIWGWYPLGLTGLISLLSKGLSRVFSSIIVEGINSLTLSLFDCPALTSVHDYWKNHSLAIQTFVGKVMSLFFEYYV